MRLKLISVLTIFILLLQFNLGCSESDGEKNVELTDQQSKVSYSIGLDIGRNFKQQGIELEMDAFMKGLKDALGDAEPMLTDEQMSEVLRTFQQEMMEKQQQERAEKATMNKQEGEKFLEENKAKEDVEVTESGLQYKVIEEGEGESPTAADMVVVHYKGTLLDGTVFDSSYERGEPATFQVGGVIPGWTEALQLMKVGSKWKLYVPSDLAYGERGAGEKIGPNATLIFDVELLEIKDEGDTQQPKSRSRQRGQ